MNSPVEIIVVSVLGGIWLWMALSEKDDENYSAQLQRAAYEYESKKIHNETGFWGH